MPKASDQCDDTKFNTTQYALPYAAGIEWHFWQLGRSRIVERHLRRVRAGKDVAPDAVVMDVGCGPGITVQHLRRAGVECYGVELGSPEVRPDVQHFIRTGILATAVDADLRARTDTILLLDVIEHLDDPARFITELVTAYPALEHVIVTVPARQELWSNYDVFYGHFLRYDKAQFRDFAKRSNLELIDLKYFFVGLYPLMWAVAKRASGRHLETKPPKGKLPLALHNLIATLFAIEERVPGLGHIVGTSLLGVMRLPGRH